MASKRSRVEEFQLTGDQLVASIKELMHEGNIRRISIRTSSGVTLLEIPLVVGLAGAIFVPLWAALGALAALIAKCTLVVERIETPGQKPPAQKARATLKKRPKKAA